MRQVTLRLYNRSRRHLTRRWHALHMVVADVSMRAVLSSSPHAVDEEASEARASAHQQQGNHRYGEVLFGQGAFEESPYGSPRACAASATNGQTTGATQLSEHLQLQGKNLLQHLERGALCHIFLERPTDAQAPSPPIIRHVRVHVRRVLAGGGGVAERRPAHLRPVARPPPGLHEGAPEAAPADVLAAALVPLLDEGEHAVQVPGLGAHTHSELAQ
mmetsp:Transcript_46303/g.148709  ORF Transcript_46303/g.148709 Transcript_46303/m.148709 type:complete len:217 (+) Transcript_46303:179-829(+)